MKPWEIARLTFAQVYDLYLPERESSRPISHVFKELAERRESVFVEMCKASNSTPRELLAMPIKQLHELAELVTKQTIPDPQKIVACLKDYINGIETS